MIDLLKNKILQPSSFAVGVWLGLFLPDTDLALLPILHHRSIITHSILIPWLLYLYFKRIPALGIAGLYAGIAIHLAADSTSALVGYGMVWTPWPFKFPLGPFSPIWLIANAFGGVWLSWKLAPGTRYWVIIGMLMVGLGYAIFNEKAFLPFVIFGLIVSGVSWKVRRQLKKET